MKRFLLSSSGNEDSPSPAPAPEEPNRSNYVSPVMAVTICALGASFLLFTYFTLRKKYNYSNPSNSTRRNQNQPTFDDAQLQVDFVDENRGPIIHPIWYINTVGLQQSAIDSISVFKYRKDGGLIEGTDCSVCLTEFEDDESLRLLPKCSHAFHIPCIDTWLRSHTNCPVCRAPVVCENAQVNAPEPNLNDSGLAEAAPADNMENRVESERSDEMGDFGGLPSEEGAIYGETKSCEFEVLSGFADRLQTLQEELPPVRRSVSMDDSSAQRIYREVANVPPVEHEGCSSNQSGQVQRLNSEKLANDIRRNVILSRLTKSPSIGFSLQKGPVAVKRSLSSASGKFSFPRRISRSQEPILPL